MPISYDDLLTSAVLSYINPAAYRKSAIREYGEYDIRGKSYFSEIHSVHLAALSEAVRRLQTLEADAKSE
jgi:hypothetical protein